MIVKLAAIALTTSLTIGAVVPAVAMNDEPSMLQSTIHFEVKNLGLDPTNVDKLTLSQLVGIMAITSSSNDDQGARFQVQQILKDAGNS